MWVRENLCRYCMWVRENLWRYCMEARENLCIDFVCELQRTFGGTVWKLERTFAEVLYVG